MITFAPYPIPVIVKDEQGQEKEGYVLYVETSAMFENDIFTVVWCDGGIVRHYASNQLTVHSNATFGIKKDNGS